MPNLTPSNVPTQTAHVRFYGVTQVYISACPLNAEARENPAAIARECQTVANQSGLPVKLGVELFNGGQDSHTFFPMA